MNAKNFWGYVLAVFVGGLAALAVAGWYVGKQTQNSTVGNLLSLL